MANDFSKGKVWRCIVAQAVPLTLAQLVQLLYNVVDRVYIGHLPGSDNLALTGIGLTFPVVTLIAAFTCLFYMGGSPLFSIARGAGDRERADRILGCVFSLLLLSAVVLTVLCLALRRPILYLFGASDESIVYAEQYLRIYLLGTVFSMLSTGMNSFINAQGLPRIGMLTVVLGAVLNLILDPIFIFALGLGVSGAAIATVLSQLASCVWVLRVLTGERVPHRLNRRYFRIDPHLTGEIVSLGMAGFIMQGTNCLVQVVCNATLQRWGGDLYVGVMTILNSVRELLSLPIHGITTGAQPVLSFNFGAKRPDRVRQGIRFTTLLGFGYTLAAWGFVVLFPGLLIRLFSSEPAMLEAGVTAMRIYFFGFVFMTLQFAGQSTFQSLGYAKRAVCFSLLRKAVIVAPLTVLLPYAGLGVRGVFWAEPISNLIGGAACFVTMYLTVYRHLKKSPPEDDIGG